MGAMRRVMGIVLLLSTAAMVGEAQIRTTTQTNTQSVRQVLRRIEDRIDLLRSSLNTTTDRTPVSNREENASVLLTNFEDAVRQLRERVNGRQATADDAQRIKN